MKAKYRNIKKPIIGTALILIAFIYLNNTSLLVEPIGSQPILLAHRGVAQDFEREGLTNETCTAARMIPSGHEYLENTLPSMQAAFEYGADVVEFDVHQTTDGQFAVFHDWTLDCRTNGSGVTREHSLATLQALDVGYGYTADEGQSWPFRDKGVGLMPSLEEVLTTFPDRDFLIDIKSNDADEGVLLAEQLKVLETERTGEIMIYGGQKPVEVIAAQLPEVQTISRPRLKQCLIRYMIFGWVGYVPTECERSVIMVPANVGPWLWGWPDRFLQRMDRAGSQVFLIGDYRGEGFSQGFDDPDRVEHLSTDYAGGIWTDRIDLMGEAVRMRGE